MNARPRGGLVDPWLAASAASAPIVFVFATLFLLPHSNGESLGGMA